MNEQEQMKQLEQMKRQVLGKILSRDAFERLSRVRLANIQLAGQVEMYIMQLAQSGKIQHVTDQQLKEILQILTDKRDISIKRK